VVHGIDLDAVEEAVRAAERGTTGEIRVALARFYFWGDIQRAAQRAFVRLGIDRTREHDGVLIFVAPWRRQFAILSDRGIHARVEAGFWQDLADRLGAAFHIGDLTGGLVRAIATIGARLAIHFPAADEADPRKANPNELPDSVALDGQRGRRG
jgi:uncharacterized membrane protein